MREHVTGVLDRTYDGELSARERARVERHLATCDRCRAALEELEALSVLLQESAPVPGSTPPDRFVAQVRLRLAPRQPLTERRWVKVGGLAFPVALVGAWIVVQVTWLFVAAALVAVELGWGAGLGLQPTGGIDLLALLSGGWRGGLGLVLDLVRLEALVRWLALVPVQMMLAIAALYGLWLVGLRRWQASRT
jgi:hypothetical protein